MPSGCSDHRRRFPQYAATTLAVMPRIPNVPAKSCNSPADSWWCRTGSSAEAFARFDDSIDFHDDRDRCVTPLIPSEPDHPQHRPEPKPRPAPDVAAGRPGAAARLGAIAAMPLNDVHGKRYAVHRQLQSDAPGQD